MTINKSAQGSFISPEDVPEYKPLIKTENKEYGINETAPDYNLLNRRPKFSNHFQKEIISKISKKRRYDNPNHRFTLTIPPEDEMLVRFESRFEGANLHKAIKVSESEYNLVLCFDYNTKGHTQWFYFKMMSKLPAGTSIKLSIMNLMKPDSLYNYGMQP